MASIIDNKVTTAQAAADSAAASADTASQAADLAVDTVAAFNTGLDTVVQQAAEDAAAAVLANADAVVTGLVEDEDSDTRAALSATYGKRHGLTALRSLTPMAPHVQGPHPHGRCRGPHPVHRLTPHIAG